MQTLAFDGRMGASGDMLLGALLAVGADSNVLSPVEEALDVGYEIGETTRCGIAATTVDVLLTAESTHDNSESSQDDDPSHEHDHGHNHGHSHGHNQEKDHEHDHPDHDHEHDHPDHDHEHEHPDHDHEHDHPDHDHEHDHPDHDHEHDHPDHDHEHAHSHAEGAGPARTFPEVVEIVESLDIPQSVSTDAIAIFELLGEAEASVHGTSLEDTHFHEVGADDAIADVVGVCLLCADLDPDRIVTTPLAAGGGTVRMSHGSYPVPPPAVVELAERADWELRGGPVETELLTPTGAAILAHLADGVETLPSLQLAETGYGAGNKRFDSHPNVVRALVGESTADLNREPITVLETHIDDATPETLGGLHETLAEAGALDVTVVPTTMKKSRPGHLVKIVTSPEDARPVAHKLATETGTLGVREHGSGHRFVADRSIETVTVEIEGKSYDLDVKVARFGEDGSVFDVSCEYDDAQSVAAQTTLSVREILRRAESVAREKLSDATQS